MKIKFQLHVIHVNLDVNEPFCVKRGVDAFAKYRPRSACAFHRNFFAVSQFSA